LFIFSGGIGTGIGKIWYRKKVSEPVSDKFGTGTYFRRQNLGILKIYNGYRYRIGAGTGKFSFFQVVSEPVSENFGTGKSLGTGIGKIWYRKKVSEPVSEKFGNDKSTGIGIENIWYRKKSRYRYRSTFWVPSHTDIYECLYLVTNDTLSLLCYVGGQSTGLLYKYCLVRI